MVVKIEHSKSRAMKEVETACRDHKLSLTGEGFKE